MDWLALKNIGSILMIIGAVIMLIAGIVFLCKNYPDEETKRKMRKSGIMYIIGSLFFIIAAFIF
ncbi:MAG: hypothetical protein IJ776_05375 [Paludibacteraceae bacterium]|nr:hypothetical protein [Paludibacteraceae bacterium]